MASSESAKKFLLFGDIQFSIRYIIIGSSTKGSPNLSLFFQEQKYQANMKSYPILLCLLLSLFLHDALAAAKWEQQQKGLSVDHDGALLATKRRGKALTESPRVYKSSMQFDDVVSWHINSWKACYF